MSLLWIVKRTARRSFRNNSGNNSLQSREVSQTAVIATYLQALNDSIDVSEKRLAAFESRVPETVWLIVFVVAIFQSFVAGFSLKRKFWFPLVVTPLVIGVVMALLADLDSPRTGLIHIEQTSMERLVHDVTGSK